jgi:hypothetical protein
MQKKLLILLFFIGLAGGQMFALSAVNEFADGQNTETEKISTPKIYLTDKTLKIENIADGVTVEIYSIVGSRVQISVLEDGVVDVSNLNKGVYIVRIGKVSQKIVIK